MSRGVRITVICEDQLHASFARSVLYERNYSRREIRFLMSPHGRGAGEQFVRGRLPEEVRALRRQSYQRLAVLAMTDADRLTVEQRTRQLDDTLKESGLNAREGDEPIAYVIPRRNIETWLLHLRGEQVDEETNYKGRINGGSCREEARRMLILCSGEADSTLLPSLRVACSELQRVP
jgi:hypothetical protein